MVAVLKIVLALACVAVFIFILEGRNIFGEKSKTVAIKLPKCIVYSDVTGTIKAQYIDNLIALVLSSYEDERQKDGGIVPNLGHLYQDCRKLLRESCIVHGYDGDAYRGADVLVYYRIIKYEQGKEVFYVLELDGNTFVSRGKVEKVDQFIDFLEDHIEYELHEYELQKVNGINQIICFLQSRLTNPES